MERTDTPLNRVRRGASVLGIVSVVGIVGHFYLHGGTILESMYWFVITVSSVGYTENSQLEASLQVFSILVIVVGMSAAGYTVGGFLQMMTEGEIDRALGARRMTKGIEKLKDHIIICGFGRIGEILAEDIGSRGESFVVLDTDLERLSLAKMLNYLVITGDATDEDVLIAAGVRRAKILISALNSDSDNVFITLTSRNLNPKLRIIARGEQPATEKKLFQAGADRVVLPAVIGARRIATLISRPHAADLIDQVTDHKILDIDLEELTVPAESPLIEKTVGHAEAHRRRKLLVVAIRKASGNMVFNPASEHQVWGGDTLIVMGRPEDIAHFRETYGI